MRIGEFKRLDERSIPLPLPARVEPLTPQEPARKAPVRREPEKVPA